MKKSLFAIAAVTAFAGAAQAQSSVTVYGILDVGYTGGTMKTTTPDGVGNTAQNIGRITNNNESGSRIGFRGTEDLGGGTSANFVFELGIQPAGNQGAQAAAVGSSLWSPNVRQSYIGLTQKGAGEVRIGLQNTLYWEQGGNMTGQLAQVAGSMLAPSTEGAGFTAAAAATPTGVNASQAAYTVRTTNTINVRSQRMSGFLAKASYTQSNSSGNLTAVAANNGVNDQSGYQVAAEYVAGKANIQASYAAFTSENAPVGVAAGWGTAIFGNSAKDNQLLVTASYDFGMLKAFAGYTDRRIQATADSNDTLTRSGYEIGVRSFLTSKVEAWASGGLGRFNGQGVGGNDANLTSYQLGSNYWLSKRTNLYGIVGANNVAGTSASGANPATAKQEIFQYAVGVRHTF
jgi:predicted porin